MGTSTNFAGNPSHNSASSVGSGGGSFGLPPAPPGAMSNSLRLPTPPGTPGSMVPNNSAKPPPYAQHASVPPNFAYHHHNHHHHPHQQQPHDSLSGREGTPSRQNKRPSVVLGAQSPSIPHGMGFTSSGGEGHESDIQALWRQQQQQQRAGRASPGGGFQWNAGSALPPPPHGGRQHTPQQFRGGTANVTMSTAAQSPSLGSGTTRSYSPGNVMLYPRLGSPKHSARSSSPSLSIGNTYSPSLYARHVTPPSSLRPLGEGAKSFGPGPPPLPHGGIYGPPTRSPSVREVAKLKATVKRQQVVFTTVLAIVAILFLRIVIVPFVQSDRFENFFMGSRRGYTERLREEDRAAALAVKQFGPTGQHPNLAHHALSRTTVYIESSPILAAFREKVSEAMTVSDIDPSRPRSLAVVQLEEAIERIVDQAMTTRNNVPLNNASMASTDHHEDRTSPSFQFPEITDEKSHRVAVYMAFARDAVASERSKGRDVLEPSFVPDKPLTTTNEVKEFAKSLVLPQSQNEQQNKATRSVVLDVWKKSSPLSADSRGTVKPSEPELTTCQWDSHGRDLVVDDKGFVCNVASFNSTEGCCLKGEKDGSEMVTVHRATPDTCTQWATQDPKRGTCFGHFEHCVACCLNSSNPPGYRSPTSQQVEALIPAETSKAQKFSACRLTCRSGPASMTGERKVIGIAGVQLNHIINATLETTSATTVDSGTESSGITKYTLPVYEQGYSEVHLHYGFQHRYCFESLDNTSSSSSSS